MAAGDADGAIAEIRATEAIARANFGERHLLVGAAKIHIGTLHAAHGRLAEALIEHRDAAALFAELLGATHPHVALSECAAAAALHGLGRHEEALAAAERGAAIYAQRPDERDYDQARCELIRARALHALARPIDARSALDAVISRVDQVACPPDQRSDLRWLLARELYEQRGAAERERVLALLAGADALIDPKDLAERARLRAALR